MALEILLIKLTVPGSDWDATRKWTTKLNKNGF